VDSKLAKVISENKEALRDAWLKSIFGTYPKEAAAILNSSKDQFQNPLGYVTKEAVKNVLDCIATHSDESTLRTALFPLIQVRAIQELTPSEAIAPAFLFKEALVSVVGQQRLKEMFSEFLKLSDLILSTSVDILTECKLKVSEVRIEEIKRNMYMLARQGGRVNASEDSNS
jgi:hypothetical protein